MMKPTTFFSAVRASLFGGTLTQSQVDGMNTLVTAMSDAHWPISWTAYGLATAYHETDRTMRPVRERGTGDRNHNGEDDWFEKYDTGRLAAQLGNTPQFDGDGQKWCGRGYPQVTGHANYAKLDAALHLDGALLDNPDLMLQPDIAAPAMVIAMQTGMFTGKSCASYLPHQGFASTDQFVSARRIINGQDRAGTIAGYAVLFQKALSVGEYA